MRRASATCPGTMPRSCPRYAPETPSENLFRVQERRVDSCGRWIRRQDGGLRRWLSRDGRPGFGPGMGDLRQRARDRWPEVVVPLAATAAVAAAACAPVVGAALILCRSNTR